MLAVVLVLIVLLSVILTVTKQKANVFSFILLGVIVMKAAIQYMEALQDMVIVKLLMISITTNGNVRNLSKAKGIFSERYICIKEI